MADQSLYWIWLTGIPSVGPVTQKKLLEHFGTPTAIYRADKGELTKVKGMRPALVEQIRNARSLEQAQKIVDGMVRKSIRLLTFHDRLYPHEVKTIPKSPIILYYRGRILENGMGVGLIGSRHCTAYGKQVAVETADFLARHHIPVISGMAKGIDGYAHTACLKADGYTMAFLGSGVDICYPKEHESLMNKIVEKGVVLSSYPPGTPLYPHHFYQRNFLISAWSSKLLVIEAGEKSGALSAVNYAKQMKREIWAVPNHIYSQESEGSNRLIGQGAHIFLHPHQLIPSLPEKKSPKHLRTEPPKEKSFRFHSPKSHHVSHLPGSFETRIVEELRTLPKTIDQLVQSLNKNHSEVIESLSLLELEGIIRMKPNHMVELI